MTTTTLPACPVCGARAEQTPSGRLTITHDAARHGVPTGAAPTGAGYAPPLRAPTRADGVGCLTGYVPRPLFGYDPEDE